MDTGDDSPSVYEILTALQYPKDAGGEDIVLDLIDPVRFARATQDEIAQVKDVLRSEMFIFILFWPSGESGSHAILEPHAKPRNVYLVHAKDFRPWCLTSNQIVKPRGLLHK